MNKPNKKAQLKMFETIAVLLVFFFLLGISAIFYSYITKSTAQQEATKQTEHYATQIAQKAFFMPELACTLAEVTQPNCFDVYKIQAFTQNQETNYYYTIFGQSKITVTLLWPEREQQPTWTLYDWMPPTITGSINSYSPVILQNSTNNKNYFGIIEVTAYSE